MLDAYAGLIPTAARPYTRADTAGRAYLDLRNLARSSRRPVDVSIGNPIGPLQTGVADDRRQAKLGISMATRQELHDEIDALSEPELPKVRIVIEEDEPDVVGPPEGWGIMDNGQPAPNVVAAVRRSREAH